MTDIDTPVDLKLKGNKAFSKKQFQEALMYYTMAIEQSNTGKVDHTFYSNRAAVFLEIQLYDNCIKDCDECMKINPKFAKSYFRKAKALVQLGKHQKAIECLDLGIFASESQDLEDLRSQIKKEMPAETDVEVIDTSIQNLVDEMENKNALLSKIAVRHQSSSQRGLYATQDIKQGDMIVWIPLAQLITPQKEAGSDIFKKLGLVQDESFDRNATIKPSSAFFLEEMNRTQKDPVMKEYFQLLPKNFDEFPVFFTDNQKYRDMLEGCQFCEVVDNYVSKMKAVYESICEKVPDFRKNSFKKFLEAKMLLSSRLFGANINGQESAVMVPFADMLNHSLNHNVEFSFKADSQGFVLEAIRDISKDEEIFGSYGQKPNMVYLMSYGFVNQGCSFEQAPIKIVEPIDDLYNGFSESSPGFKLKERYLEEKGTSGQMRVSRNMDSQVIKAFLGWIILDVVYLSTSDINSKKEFEAKIWDTFLALTERTFKMYPTSIREDEEILKGELNQIEKNCVVFRLEQKKVLRDLVEIAKLIKKSLEVQADLDKYQGSMNYVRSILEPWCQKKNIQE